MQEKVLVEACAYAGCTRAQTSALRLLYRGASIRQVASELGLSYGQARRAADNGRARLERAYTTVLRRSLCWFRAVLDCVRNHRDCRPSPVLTYARVAGGYDRTPVTVRSRPHGAVAEDLVESHRAFLRCLLDQLAP